MGDFGAVGKDGVWRPYFPPAAQLNQAHEVTLSDFHLSRYEVTWFEYDTYRLATDKSVVITLDQRDIPREPYDRDLESIFNVDYPAMVNWHEAKAFCLWLAKETGLPFDLPTSAQWEFAARNRGFRHVEDIESDAFTLLSRLAMHSVLTGASMAIAGVEAARSSALEITLRLERYLQAHQSEIEKEQLAITSSRNILRDLKNGGQSWVRHAPPEVKGPLLDVLCFDYGLSFWDKYTYGYNVREQAILSLLELSQSWRDYHETVSRMNARGTKANFSMNRARLVDLMGLFPALQINRIERSLHNKVAVADQPVSIARYFSRSENRYA